ncbi:MAG TPA: putative baseplate assembly protein [Solirubrobacteraceae bacterium]|nr:putative baseplate assembly protein [Solirubrobacteraceae bacterium]
MSVRLDARTESDLVIETQSRLAEVLPELRIGTDGDPGRALTELFGWMTGIAVERLARVPDKLHLALLDMLGIELKGPAAARADVRLNLSATAERPVSIRKGTEIGTLRSASEPSIVFTLDEDFTIAPLRPVAYVIERAGAAKEIGVADGVAYPHGPDRIPFGQPPAIGDALYLGFEESIARLVLEVSIEASMARGAGVRPEDPPLRWEASQGGGGWAEVEVLSDQTGGFNFGSGTVELECPAGSGVEPVAGRRLHWLRCRIAQTTRLGNQPAAYQHAPEIFQITAAPVGARLSAEHSALERHEPLGTSDGEPGQAFALRFAPVLTLRPGETLEIQDPAGDWEPWDEVDSFADSGPEDRHFTIDEAHGLIRLGPELRESDAGVKRSGAIPAKGAALRMSRYRHGGGRIGNVGASTLTTLRSAIPGVASVTNPAPALGGVDAQTVQEARNRAALEIRTRHRAVTAQDYEFLATDASPRVARAVRIDDGEPGVALGILPRVDPADRRLSLQELTPDPELLELVARHLDGRKFAGCPVRLSPVRLRGVSVVVNLEASPRADTEQIERRVSDSLYAFLNPLVGSTANAGWPFGRALNQGELYAVVLAVPGVESVRILRLYELDLLTGQRASKAAGRQISLAADELIASGEHIVRVARRDS